jgi:hypothetical protein
VSSYLPAAAFGSLVVGGGGGATKYKLHTQHNLKKKKKKKFMPNSFILYKFQGFLGS